MFDPNDFKDGWDDFLQEFAVSLLIYCVVRIFFIIWALTEDLTRRAIF